MAGALEFNRAHPRARARPACKCSIRRPTPSPHRCAMDSSQSSSGASPCASRANGCARPICFGCVPACKCSLRRGACQRLREADLFRVLTDAHASANMQVLTTAPPFSPQVLTDAHDSVAAQIVRDFEGCAPDLERARSDGLRSRHRMALDYHRDCLLWQVRDRARAAPVRSAGGCAPSGRRTGECH